MSTQGTAPTAMGGLCALRSPLRQRKRRPLSGATLGTASCTHMFARSLRLFHRMKKNQKQPPAGRKDPIPSRVQSNHRRDGRTQYIRRVPSNQPAGRKNPTHQHTDGRTQHTNKHTQHPCGFFVHAYILAYVFMLAGVLAVSSGATGSSCFRVLAVFGGATGSSCFRILAVFGGATGPYRLLRARRLGHHMSEVGSPSHCASH
eukprot:6462666-Amphidinium_carterae.1